MYFQQNVYSWSKPALYFKPFRQSMVIHSEPNIYSSSKLKSALAFITNNTTVINVY